MKPWATAIFSAAMMGTVLAAEPELPLELGVRRCAGFEADPGRRISSGVATGEAGRGDDELQQNARVTKDFYMSRTPVTRGQWERFVAETAYRSEAESGAGDAPLCAAMAAAAREHVRRHFSLEQMVGRYLDLLV